MTIQTVRRKRISLAAPSRFPTKTDLLTGGASVRAVDYARASKDPHGRGKSTRDQLANNGARIRQYGWSHTGSFCDNDKGASIHSNATRVRFEALGDVIDAGGLDVLVVWDVSRQQRDLAVFTDLRTRCIKAGVYYWLVDQNLYDLRDRQDRLRLGMDAVIAEHAADTIRENVRLGLAANTRDGKPHGKTPFGFVREYHPNSRELIAQRCDERLRCREPHQPWSPAEVVREMRRRIVANEGLEAIADDLTARGIPTPRQLAAFEDGAPLGPHRWAESRWTGKSVRDIVLNPAVTGRRVANGPVTWDALFTGDEYDEAVSVLLDPRRQTNQGASREPLYLASGVARCGVCVAALSYHRASLSYRCRSRRVCVAIPAGPLDEAILGWFTYWATNPERLAEFKAINADGARKAASLALKVDKMKKDLDALRDEVANPAWAGSMLMAGRRERALMEAIEEATASMYAATVPPVLKSFVGKTEAEAVAIWQGLTLMARRAVLRAVADIRVYPAGKGRTPRNDPEKRKAQLARRIRIRPSGEGSVPPPLVG